MRKEKLQHEYIHKSAIGKGLQTETIQIFQQLQKSYCEANTSMECI